MNKRLHEDQVAAQTRRANFEKTLFQPGQEIKETNVASKTNRPVSGTGFSAKNTKSIQAEEWAKVLKVDGVIRLDNCLKKTTTTAMRAHILRELALSRIDIATGIVGAREVLGMEAERKLRDDYLMSFGPPSAVTEGEDLSAVVAGHPMATALNELFGDDGKLRQLYEIIVTKKGTMYELAVMVTEPGADRQMIHADMPYKKEPPLYSIFCALQDVTMAMGPTIFLPGTATSIDHQRWEDKATFDEYLSCKTPTFALLKAGDLIVYDPRILHCGAENEPGSGHIRAMFNVGFRNPNVVGDFGYKGSLRTGYSDKISFDDLTKYLSGYVEGNKKDPFSKLGNGLFDVDTKSKRDAKK